MRPLFSLPTAALAGLLGTAAAPAQTPASPTPAPAPQSDAQSPPAKQPAAKPWRLNDALGTPEWLRISGEHRTRYESLNGQFRTRQNNQFRDNEDVLVARTSLRGDVRFDELGGTLELLDSRGYGFQPDSFLDTTITNVIDVLEANVTFQFGDPEHGTHRLLAGRYTMDLGNRRLVARNAFRNTINSFGGIDYLYEGEADSVRAFWTLPTNRLPNDFASLRDNEHDWDDQDTELQFAGVYWTRRLAEQWIGEAYVFGLHERGDTSRRRELLTPGVRIVRNGGRGDWFGEFEGTYQFGDSKTGTNAALAQLDHSAWFAHLSVGYTFDHELEPFVRVAYDWASGDDDPNDGDNNRFDTLFGARRFEYGPTGIWGAIARANLRSPEFRVGFKPSKSTRFIAAIRDARLDSDRDAWTPAGNVRDVDGSAGGQVGQQYEVRLQWDPLPKNLRLEIGGAYLVGGDWQDEVGRGGDARYGYAEVTFWF